jgi:hypothetical protein
MLENTSESVKSRTDLVGEQTCAVTRYRDGLSGVLLWPELAQVATSPLERLHKH